MKTKLSIEESARLIELGVDAKLASKHTLGVQTPTDFPNVYRMVDGGEPIFTLADLLSILPKDIIADEQKSDNHIYVCPLSMRWDVKNMIWEARYEYMEYFTAPELIDALNQLLIWCMENHYISTEKYE